MLVKVDLCSFDPVQVLFGAQPRGFKQHKTTYYTCNLLTTLTLLFCVGNFNACIIANK